MNVHEYQAKALFREYGVPVPDGELANTPAEAAAAAGCPSLLVSEDVSLLDHAMGLVAGPS